MSTNLSPLSLLQGFIKSAQSTGDSAKIAAAIKEGVTKASRGFDDQGQATGSEQLMRANFGRLVRTDMGLDTLQNDLSEDTGLKEKDYSANVRANLQTLVSNLVTKFKEIVFNKYFDAYFGKGQVKTTGVTTLVDTAFNPLYEGGFKGFEQSPDYQAYNNRFTEVKNLLQKNLTGKNKELKYFDWMDISGVLAKNLKATTAIADRLKQDGFTKAYIMGMGGSSQFPKIINGAFPETREGGMQLEVMDGTDAHSIQTKLDALQVKPNETEQKTAFVIISKSGNTFECMHNIQSILDHLTKLHRGNKEAAIKQFVEQAVFVSEPGNGKLNKLQKELEAKYQAITGKAIQIKYIEHPPEVGGRFSAFSVVGMLPAALKGLDTSEFMRGAQDAINELLNANSISDSSIAKLGLIHKLTAESGEFAARFLATYNDRLHVLGAANEQLAGESNNKGDKGKNNGVDALPIINAKGPVFQHSTIEGLNRNDKLKLVFEQVLLKNDDQDMVHNDYGIKGLEDFARKSLHQDTMTSLALPFAKHLRDNRNNPVITTIIDHIDEYNVGYVLMRDMLSTIVTAGLQANTEDGSAPNDQMIPVNSINLKSEVPRTIKNNMLRAVYQDGVEAYKKAKGGEPSDPNWGAISGTEVVGNVELAA